MKENKPGIYIEQPIETDTLEKSEIEAFQLQYQLTEADIEQAFRAVGNNKMKLKTFLASKAGQPTVDAKKDPIAETAINPNPKANANIVPAVEKLGPNEIQHQSQVVNHEVTDGEDG